MMAITLALVLYCLVSIFIGMILEYILIKKVALKKYFVRKTKQENDDNNNNNNNHEFNEIGIVGYGQIGSAINTIYCNKQSNNNYNIHISDPYKNMNADLSNCDLINICIAFNDYETFKENLINLNLARDRSVIIVIHSTMIMGTTNKLQNEKELSGHVFISSPCRGVHPNLVSGIYTFEKYIGISEMYYSNLNINKRIMNHFQYLNLKYFICKANEADLAKVISTTLYGLNISVTEDIGQICDYHNLSFNNVFTNWQIDYNNGYKKLKKTNVLRPILTRIPNKEKIIGGHCVLPNCVILQNIQPLHITKQITDFILRYSDEKSRKHHTINHSSIGHGITINTELTDSISIRNI